MAILEKALGSEQLVVVLVPADVFGLFSNNVVSFLRNLVPSWAPGRLLERGTEWILAPKSELLELLSGVRRLPVNEAKNDFPEFRLPRPCQDPSPHFQSGGCFSG